MSAGLSEGPQLLTREPAGPGKPPSDAGYATDASGHEHLPCDDCAEAMLQLHGMYSVMKQKEGLVKESLNTVCTNLARIVTRFDKFEELTQSVVKQHDKKLRTEMRDVIDCHKEELVRTQEALCTTNARFETTKLQCNIHMMLYEETVKQLHTRVAALEANFVAQQKELAALRDDVKDELETGARSRKTRLMAAAQRKNTESEDAWIEFVAAFMQKVVSTKTDEDIVTSQQVAHVLRDMQESHPLIFSKPLGDTNKDTVRTFVLEVMRVAYPRLRRRKGHVSVVDGVARLIGRATSGPQYYWKGLKVA